MSLQIKYADAPVGAQVAAAFSGEAQPFGGAEQLRFGAQDRPWATLEPGGWTLDGTREILPEASGQIGWWSRERTGDDGRFLRPPVISVSFPQPYTATGITFAFWPSLAQWCREIYVAWYNGETLLAETIAYPDGPQWVLQHSVEAFDKIEIRLLATNLPGQFVKIQQIQIGQVVVFLQNEIVRVSLLNEADPSLCELPVDTMWVEIQDKAGRMLIPQKNQQMQLYRNGELVATHYISDSSRETERHYTFQCQSAIGRLEDDYLGGIYDRKPVKALLGEILQEFPYSLDPQLAQETVTGYLPVCTRRQALQQIAFAIGGMVTMQSDGVICLAPLPQTVCAEFTAKDIFSGAKVSREAQTATVQVFAHHYTAGDETEVLLNGETVRGSGVLFVFSQPHHQYEITGGTVDASGENWVRITADGAVTLTGKQYMHSVSVWAKSNSQATAAEKSNLVCVENATLIHAGNVENALQRLYAYNGLKYVLDQQAVITGQKVGQLARSINPWSAVTEGYIVGMESEFTGNGHTASVTLRGREVENE